MCHWYRHPSLLGLNLTRITKPDKTFTDDVENLRNVFQRPRLETMHQVLLPGKENLMFVKR